MYRRYSIGSGGTLAFPAFPGDRLLFNGDAALIAALKVVALQRVHKPERLVFLADRACGQPAWELLRLLQRRSGWEAGVGPATLAVAAHVISFGPMSHVAAAQWAQLPQEIRIYFSPTVLQERLALVFPPPELHRAFVIQQQRGGALNEWALKFLSYRSDQEQILDQLVHNL